MTKRRTKNAKPTGFNKSLGNALQNRAENRFTASSSSGPAVNENKPTKVLASVTHENAYEEFFNNAELAGKDFGATRWDFQLLQTGTSVVNVQSLQDKTFEDLTKKFGHLLKVPRRPDPNSYSTPEGLEAQEMRNFLEWRTSLAQLAEGDGVVLTPFERNLELWRQLWRVVERSDVVVQIVDARNPLLFRNKDLEAYMGEFSPPKKCLLLVNKADLLTNEQIAMWKDYFRSVNIQSVFWSATNADDTTEEKKAGSSNEHIVSNTTDLISTLKDFAFSSNPGKTTVTVGMIGYPNVGKSSTINKIIGAKKTSVSATPGKTKHFQTLIVDEELTLCDCPGLVMPSLGFSPAEMLLNGILPVDQMRDSVPPIQLLCNRVPKAALESLYSILLPKPADFEDSNRPPTAHEFQTTLAFMKGFMTEAGVPDGSRVARIVVKDVFNGKIKWTAAPPGVDQQEFDRFTYRDIKPVDIGQSGEFLLNQLRKRNYLVTDDVLGNAVDDRFFNKESSGFHVRSAKAGNDGQGKKHFKGKKDKLRRVHADLDA
ncbi:unnamed protein product [Bursaphelenchus okinawaensis]|uniref:Large subunit GTPase 1 homolog n=1 Tax=Bursaphelenchus okinawaensis TaxID=465554 RepID=A0A811JUB4_9BILA|nr:unnamed protein product [Bursaphelenchus okinawaensis]CAG9083401.1 unnamed protein product [Bursaphelenchus okinawaensis]